MKTNAETDVNGSRSALRSFVAHFTTEYDASDFRALIEPQRGKFRNIGEVELGHDGFWHVDFASALTHAQLDDLFFPAREVEVTSISEYA